MAFQKMTEYSDDQIRKMFDAGDFSAIVDGNKETRERIIRVLKDGAKPKDARVLELEEKNSRLEDSLDYERRHQVERVNEEAFYGLSPIIEDEDGDPVKLDLRFVKHLGKWAQEVMEYAEQIEREVFERRAKETEPVVLKSKYDRDLTRARHEWYLAEKRSGIERDLRRDYYSNHEDRFNKKVDELQKIIDEQQEAIARLREKLDQHDQEPEVQQPAPHVEAMTKLLHDKGFGLYDIDPTAYEGEIWCEPCKTYRQGGCLIHGVSEEAQAAVEGDLNPAAPHGGSDDEDLPVVTAQPVEPEETPKPVTKPLNAIDELNAVLAELELPGHIEHPEWSSKKYVWVIDGAYRELVTDKVRIAYCLRNGQLKVERHKHIVSGSEYGKRLEELPSEPEVDTNFEDYSRRELIEIYLNLKRQKDEQETSPEIVSECPNCERLKHSAKDWKISWEQCAQQRDQVEEARAHLAEKNFELEQENGRLKQQLATLEQDVDTLTNGDEVVKELQAEVTSLKMENDHVLGQNRLLDEKCQKYQARIEEQNRLMDDKNKVISDQQKEIDELREKLAQYEGMGA